LGGLATLFLCGVSVQALDILVRMQRLEAICTKYEPLVKSDRDSEHMGVVLDFLFARTILSTKQLAGNLDMPCKTAWQYIEKLAKAGILCEVTWNARNQIYRAHKIFGILKDI
jgi:hypothetical protein